MTIDWWTLGLQIVNVLVLVWILAHFLFRPVARIIDDRQKAAHAALDEAQAARDDATTARNAAQAETEALARQRAELLEKAEAEAKDEKRRLLDEAQAAADTARAEGKAELEQMRAAQERALAEQAGNLSIDIARRLLDRLPENARIAGFVDGLAEAVADLPEATREGIGADGPVRLRAARDLTSKERDDVAARLTAVLGRSIEIDVATDPDLIAGLELDAPHAIVRNHFRADLDRIRAELAGHD